MNELERVNFNRRIFQGASLCPLLLVNTLISLALVLRKLTLRIRLGKEKLNNLFIVDLKLYNSSDDIDCLVGSVSGDTGMKFGILGIFSMIWYNGIMTGSTSNL